MSCGTNESLHHYMGKWSSTHSEDAGITLTGARKVLHSTISLGISTHFCTTCLERINEFAFPESERYRKATRFSLIILLILIVLSPFFYYATSTGDISIFQLLPHYTLELVQNPLYYLFSLEVAFTILGGLTGIWYLYSNSRFYRRILKEPYWTSMYLDQIGKSGIRYRFKNRKYVQEFSKANPGAQVSLEEQLAPQRRIMWYPFLIALLFLFFFAVVVNAGPSRFITQNIVIGYAINWLLAIILTLIPSFAIKKRELR